MDSTSKSGNDEIETKEAVLESGVIQKKDSNRHVAFWGKCQVIPPNECYSEEDYRAGDDYFASHGGGKMKHKRNGSKGSILQLPFRSSKISGRRWSNTSSSNETSSSNSRGNGGITGSHSFQSGINKPLSLARPSSVPIRSPSLSPSLPISRDGSAHKLRQKLVSPPPPTPMTDDSISPIICSKKSLEEQESPIANENEDSSEIESPKTPLTPLPLARPVAVRKPLMFGFDKENFDDDGEMRTNIHSVSQLFALRIPPIIYAPGISKKAINETKPESNPTAAAILDWEEPEEKSLSDETEDEIDEKGIPGGIGEETPWSTRESFEEEDLHGECNCANCEPKMMAALSPTYSPNWTRSARRKYLADRKEAMNEESKKSVKPPIWLKSEESEIAADITSSSTTKLRDIRADEVDTKHGKLQIEVVSKKSDTNDQTDIGNALKMDSLDDPSLNKEVEEEVRLREEENRLKKTRNEMRKLSGDCGSGLRVGGGGARAMMRQLEEAEQAERRAKVERSRSPKIINNEENSVNTKEDSRPPLRIASPTVDLANIVGKQRQTSSPPHLNNEKSSRTPSPLKRILSNSKSPTNSIESIPGRHPSPSLLIKRELALGIPVQSNIVTARSRQAFGGSIDNRSRASSVNAIDSRNHPSKLSNALDDSKHHVSADDVSNQNQISIKSNGNNLQQRNNQPILMGRSVSSNGPSTKQGINRRPSLDMVEGGSSSIDSTTKERPINLKRSNTTGSRSVQHQPQLISISTTNGKMGQYGSSPLSVDQFGSINQTSPIHFVEGKIDKARAKARSSFKDLMARMKN